MLTLANPAGLWALLGLPAVLLIHFLQRKAVVLPLSTLFLLEKTQRESASGRRFDRLMNSVPLWLQLASVLVLTWLLAEPRYQKPRSVQRIAVVLDASASMSVSKDDLAKRLIEALPALKGLATEAEYTLFESSPNTARLYAGSSTEQLAATLRAWNPRGGLTDPTHALRLARSLVSREGIVVYGTDTPLANPPFDACVLSLGKPVDNVGFTGARFETKEGALVWQALVRNYSAKPQERTWTIEADGRRSEPATIHLDPGAIVTLQAAFPQEAKSAVVRLAADAFTLDDVLPLVAPKPKSLRLFTATGHAFEGLVKRLVHSLDAVEPVTDAAQADLVIARYDPLDPVLPAGNAAVFVHDETRSGQYLHGGIVPERHPLIDGLNWQSLLVRETIELERKPADTVLLWQGPRALIFVQKETPANGPAATRLCFNFDLGLSNAERLPAFAVLLHRFADSIRRAKIAPEAAILETGQPVDVARQTGADAPPLTATFTPADGGPATAVALPRIPFPAPADPGFLRVRQGDQVLLDAAVHFGDTREADFSQCAPTDTLAKASGGAVERHTEEDHWWRLWFILVLAALLVSWHFTRERVAPVPEMLKS